jgi:hypothetical protein
MVGTLRFETPAERLGCAIACAFMLLLIGVPVGGALVHELSAPAYVGALVVGVFALVGGWIGFRR